MMKNMMTMKGHFKHDFRFRKGGLTFSKNKLKSKNLKNKTHSFLFYIFDFVNKMK
jgi:hypothetical protein